MVDGTIARKFNAVSEFGSKLDTAADMVFAVVCMMKILPIISIPGWLWFMISVITGLFWFLFPLTLDFIEPIRSLGVIGIFAMTAAIQEGLKIYLFDKRQVEL